MSLVCRSKLLPLLLCLRWAEEVCAVFHGLVKSSLPRAPVVTDPTGIELVSDEMLPRAFDWRNVGGRNFVTPDWNQHIPVYCGACWIHGTGSQLNDRIKILRNASFPDVMLSRQVMANCVPTNGSDKKASLYEGGCFGGDAPLIYKYMRSNRLPDETCMPWTAQNQECVPENVCKNCKPPTGFNAALDKGVSELAKIDMGAGCYPIENWIGYQVGDYGWVNGSMSMMKEIYARGPITCSLMADDDFMYNYAQNVGKHGGVYASDRKYSDTDHLVEVVGWGETSDGLKYWSVRNSWGTYWAEGGWFKIRRGTNDLLIEGDCTWAVPTFDNLNAELTGKVLGDYMKGVTRVLEPIRPLDLMQQKVGAATSSPLLFLVAVLGLGALLGSLLAHWRRPSLRPPEVLLG